MIRRSFIKKAGITAGGLLLHNTLLKAVSLPFESRKINIAVIGCGDRGTGLMQVLKQIPDLYQIKAICDVLDFRLENGRKIAPGALAVKDYKVILDHKDIDAVLISVPLNMHFQIAKDALLAGKHVYLEKTMTYNIPQALELVALVKSKPKQILQVGHQYRYTPLYFKVKEMIDQGYLGKVTQIDCRWDRNGSWRRPVPDPSLERQINWRMYKEYSGGLPAELLSHQIDFINWVFDTHADEVIATGGIDFYKDGRETYDNVQAVLRYSKEHMIGNFGATCANSHDGYLFKIKGSKGSISLLVDEGIYYPEKETLKKYNQTVDGVTGATKITWNKDGGIPILTEPIKDGSWYALTDFHKCVTSGEMPTSNVFTGSKTAISVHMINNALFGNAIENWKPGYNV
ncbi:Gfo/Idh/MocA family oxidoreductase [Pedobacter sp.]|jgi:predicted dehydrogenase|uniref:Gfo/Idh/MocA family protein n=1 Tax=Pedobacter sp. TaxID=1411316 RepID=UPI002B588C18|nr:Gfo/Idh/MocA family oxidoreductase [Pedobacter sp.]HWW42492.1 Gfo/Idh/MocA family oxidoreductase [Pedobacter sp.]